MRFVDNMLNWAADKVQTFTGEKKRRELVQQSKDKYGEIKDLVKNYVSTINEKIYDFNRLIQKINNYRSKKVGDNISLLHNFLGKFGNVKAVGEYAAEKTTSELVIPKKEFERKEQYISDIDWSKDEVFIKTFDNGVFRMKQKTEEQNISMVEQLEKFKLEIKEKKNQFNLQEYNIQKDIELAQLYLECVTTISDYIDRCILPELEVVEAFFQSLVIKNKIIAGGKLQNLVFTNDLLLLKDSPYEEHFQFVKNSFMFYIISCKIIDTPVLTKLIKSQVVDDSDLSTLKKSKKTLLEQKDKVNEYLMFTRG